MTEFTSEWIEGAREVVGKDKATVSGQIAFIVLDELERLQAEKDKLIAENEELKKRIIKSLIEYYMESPRANDY